MFSSFTFDCGNQIPQHLLKCELKIAQIGKFSHPNEMVLVKKPANFKATIEQSFQPKLLQFKVTDGD